MNYDHCQNYKEFYYEGVWGTKKKQCIMNPVSQLHQDKETTTTITILHIEAETKWPTFSRRHFKLHFLELK